MNKTKSQTFDSPKQQCVEVKVVFGRKAEAQKVAQILLDEKLIACGQIYQIESIYVWKGKREQAKEYCLEMKTKRSCFQRILEVVKKLHSYQCPEIVATDILELSDDYYKWIIENTN